MRFSGRVARMREMRNACNILVGKSGCKRPHGRHRRRGEDNIKMDLKAIVCKNQDRDQWLDLVKTVMNLQVPYKVRNFLTNWVTISFSRRNLLLGV